MDKEAISGVATVARLKLDAEDMEKLGRDFDRIFEYFSKLGQLKLAQEEACYATPNATVLRKDEAKGCNISITKNFPKARNGLIKVPRGL